MNERMKARRVGALKVAAISFSVRQITLALLASGFVLSCRPQAKGLPTAPPHYHGQISGWDFDSSSSGVGGLSTIRMVAAPGTSEVPSGFARIDGSTRFITAARARIDWTQIGLSDLRWAHVRVWYNGAPTSATTTEVWGNARLIVVDSAGIRPTSRLAGE